MLGEKALKLPFELAPLLCEDLGWCSIPAQHSLQQRASCVLGALGRKGDEIHPLDEVLDADEDVGVTRGGFLQRPNELHTPPMSKSPNRQRLQLLPRLPEASFHLGTWQASVDCRYHCVPHAPPPLVLLQPIQLPLHPEMAHAPVRVQGQLHPLCCAGDDHHHSTL